ncbi:MAG: AI-2E family transporter [Terracidiphilus sp.]
MDGAGTARILAKFWYLTVAVLAVAILYLAKILFLPLAFAVLFAFLLAPVVALLERFRLPRGLAAAIVIVGFSSLLAGVAWLLFTQLVSIANDLPIYRDNITQKIEAIHPPSDSAIGRAQEEVEELSEELGLANSTMPSPWQHDKQGSRKPLGATPDRPMQVREVAKPTGRLDQLGGIAQPLMTSFLTAVFTFFVILQREDLRNRLIRLNGEQNLTMMTHAMNDASARISRYFRLQLLVNICFGILVAIALSLIGLPHAFLFGALATLSRFIPYFGALTAALLPTVLSLAVFQGWLHSLAILCTFVILEVFTANYVEPHIYGRHTGLTAFAILVAAGFWTLIWGPVGLVLSMPLTVCLVVIGRHVPSLEFLSILLGDRPAIPPPACFYQRLLARDEREAAEIIDTCLKDETLENIYDSVLIPALLMSEKDRQQGDLADSAVSFIHATVRELVEELGYREKSAAENSARPMLRATRPPAQVLCVPLRDDSDELVSRMLAQLLDCESMHAASTPPGSSTEEILATVTKQHVDLVVLSGLSPFALARAHRLNRLLRTLAPQPRILVGLWGENNDSAEKVAEKLKVEDKVHFSTTLSDAVGQARRYFFIDPTDTINTQSELLDSREPAA